VKRETENAPERLSTADNPAAVYQMRKPVYKSANPGSDISVGCGSVVNSAEPHFFKPTKFKMKEGFIIINITKDEAFAMRKQIGDYAVKSSHTKHPKYYLVENPKFLKTLERYRKSKYNN
jgi:hypothetical protein